MQPHFNPNAQQTGPSGGSTYINTYRDSQQLLYVLSRTHPTLAAAASATNVPYSYLRPTCFVRSPPWLLVRPPSGSLRSPHNKDISTTTSQPFLSSILPTRRFWAPRRLQIWSNRTAARSISTFWLCGSAHTINRSH